MKKIAVLILLVIVSSFGMLCTDTKYSNATLNTFRSHEELKDFLQNTLKYPSYLLDESLGSVRILDTPNHSSTNIQVEGVDEADIIKTDGEYFYVISDKTVFIVKAYPAEEAEMLSKITNAGKVRQLFVNAERLVVFVENNLQCETQTFIKIYDTSKKANPLLKNEIAVNGYYFSARMIGNYVYAIIRKAALLLNGEVSLPRIYYKNRCKVVPITEIHYSSIIDYGYLFTTIVAVNVFEDEQRPNDETILSGLATDIYVSLENVYLTMSDSDTTVLHRIHIENGEISIVACCEVPGDILNQFSMDEHKGYFRIATTSRMTSSLSEPSQRHLNLQNNLYVLNMDLDVVGQIENIAPGENIHSVRYMGDICYLVTFRKVDPFFAISLADPYNPKILGELKISGYSDYLHLYDENHVVGVGKETIAAEQGDFSWYQGVKISLFDVSNMSEPKEIAKYEIGDRGTDSPVLTDHKAFLFDKEKNLLVLPVSVAKVDESKYPYGLPPYASGEIVWQGAYVFTISLISEEKIMLKGTVTHIKGNYVYDISYHIRRTLYIDNVLYTISNNKVKMNSLLDMREINEINLNK